MTQYFLFFLLGLGGGALFATMAQSAVLTFKGSGVINIAVGGMAMYVAYTYAGLREGRLMVPPLPNPLAIVEGVAGWFGAHLDLPSWPSFVHFSSPVASPTAFAVSIAVAALLGLVAHLLIFKPLRDAPPLAKTVASTGLLLVLQAICILRFGTANIQVKAMMPGKVVHVAGSAVPLNRFLLLGIAVVISVVLTIVFKRTRIGWAVRAAAENQNGAILVGLSPNTLAALTWITGTVIAGAVGVLYASIVGVNPTSFILFAIPALGAALVARMESFTIAAVAGVLIGCAVSITIPLQLNHSWFPRTGAAEGLPFLVIIVAMIARGRGLPDRATATKIRLPESPEPRNVLAGFGVLLPIVAAGLIFLPFDLRGALINSLVGAVLALSFVVIVGFAGQISLMQMALAGVAALMMTRLSGQWGIPFPLDGVLAVVVASVVGVIVGLPALRIRGVQLAILTLGAAYAIERMVFSNPSYLRATDASGSVHAPSLFGFHFSVNGSFPIGSKGSPNATFGLFLLAVVSFAFLLVIRLRRSDLGRQWLAVRSNERSAASLGINVAAAKLSAFAVAACLAGAAGVLTSYQFQGVTPSPYVALASVSILATAYLGGIGSVSGAVVAGTLAIGGLSFRILDRIVHLGKFELLISGVGLVFTAIMNPEGIAGVFRATFAQLRTRRGSSHLATAPADGHTGKPDYQAVPVLITTTDQHIGGPES